MMTIDTQDLSNYKDQFGHSLKNQTNRKTLALVKVVWWTVYKGASRPYLLIFMSVIHPLGVEVKHGICF